MGVTKYEPWFVYGLHDPRSGTIFYIGISAQPTVRMRQHRTDRTPAYARYHEILKAGEQPQLIIFRECKDRVEARRIEKRLLDEYQGRLTNRRADPWPARRATIAFRQAQRDQP